LEAILPCINDIKKLVIGTNPLSTLEVSLSGIEKLSNAIKNIDGQVIEITSRYLLARYTYVYTHK